MGEDTKSKIIQTSIALFNEFGYENVSMRDIAERLKISPGNLTYHFKKKTDILYEIIQLLVLEHKSNHYTAEITLAEFHSTILNVMDHQKRYSFYYRNITELRKKYPWILKLQADYKQEFYNLLTNIFLHFEEQHWLKPGLFKNQYNDLSVAVLAVTTFWSQLNFDEDTWNMSSVVWSILLPNLTEQGILEYQKISD